MKINSVTFANQSVTDNKKNQVSFKTYNPERASMIQRRLAAKGVSAHLDGNDFVAECVEKVTDVFKKLFGDSALPKEVGFKPLREGAYGRYWDVDDTVLMNSDLDFKCFYNMDRLKEEMMKYKKIILPTWLSSLHPGHTFVHEFSHAAHWHHLKDRNGYNNAKKVWDGLAGTTVPTPIGRLITRFKLSNYAVDGNDMCEFMAERMSKDICDGLTDVMWVPYKDIDVDYSSIFSRKWNYRYSSPQSYIDYFTQQVWNGDLDEAKRVGDKVEQYLAELDAEPVPDAIANAVGVAHSLGVPLFNDIADGVSNFFEKLTDKLDRRNKIGID